MEVEPWVNLWGVDGASPVVSMVAMEGGIVMVHDKAMKIEFLCTNATRL
jgi:hypothetical protein